MTLAGRRRRGVTSGRSTETWSDSGRSGRPPGRSRRDRRPPGRSRRDRRPPGRSRDNWPRLGLEERRHKRAERAPLVSGTEARELSGHGRSGASGSHDGSGDLMGHGGSRVSVSNGGELPP